ncbi:MAG: hypothetical protein H6760_00125 [Candidatus Nomurabacteria bacterium]|nr:MAG: hypothetical protein H6760_00125 [Candidatus Nomurabacteria bacterium]
MDDFEAGLRDWASRVIASAGTHRPEDERFDGEFTEYTAWKALLHPHMHMFGMSGVQLVLDTWDVQTDATHGIVLEMMSFLQEQSAGVSA